MTPEMIARLLEYFDIKTFLLNNSPIRLAIIFGIMIGLWICAYFFCFFIQGRLEKFVLQKSAGNAENLKKSKSLMDFPLFEKVIKNIRKILYLIIFYWGLSRLVIGPVYADLIRVFFTALCIWAAIEFLNAFIPFNIDLYLRRSGTTLQTSKSRSLLPIIKGMIWAIGLTFFLDNLGFHVSTIIAGLGIAGVAVGMAGQAILADFFSYIVILLDRPFRIGDYVELENGKAGDVEYMGPKTTHLRSLNDDLIVCANSVMTKGIIVNFGNNRDREVLCDIGVVYETPLEQLKRIPQILQNAVESVTKCKFDRACLINFNSSSLGYQLVYFVAGDCENIRDFMNIRSKVNIAILESFSKENISMAYPTEHVLLTDLSNQKA